MLLEGWSPLPCPVPPEMLECQAPHCAFTKVGPHCPRGCQLLLARPPESVSESTYEMLCVRREGRGSLHLGRCLYGRQDPWWPHKRVMWLARLLSWARSPRSAGATPHLVG